MNDPYSILGLARGASKEEAKARFKALAKECHPDLYPGDAEKEKRFKAINDAHDRIKNGDADSYREYDIPAGFTPFSDMFGFNFSHVRRNSDIHLACSLTLEEAFEGKTLSVQIPGRDGPRTVAVTLPPGIRSGMSAHVPRGGNQQNMTMPPGDLFVNVRVVPHARFRTDDANNILTIVPVTVFDVLLGRPIEVVNIDGKSLTVTVPGGFDSARKLRLAGQGMPDPLNNKSARGDLLVELLVSYPALSEGQRALVEQAEQLS